MLTNHHDRLRGSDVVARFPLGFIRDGAEIFLDKLFFCATDGSDRTWAQLWQIHAAINLFAA